ncbi:MAG TPA: protein kinase [Gemmatimonadales bacterium]|nr:protein kinase [Gemmatimonadales bacterium]
MLNRLAAALGDRYAIQRELGAGGMALVYLARDLRHHRLVAIKVLRPELAASLGPERFLHEIEVAAGLQHPHIVPLYDSGAGSAETGSEGILYYVMPYVEGESLRQRLGREPQLPISEAVRIATEVASALAYAHAHGVVHRDIKPENVLLTGRYAMVADFGIARAIDTAAERRQLTATGLAVGTPMYMSPEQATGDPIDARSDQYALACVLYEMLAGAPPFTGPTPQAVISRSLTGPRPELRAARAGVSPELEQVVARGLAADPLGRFPSIQEFATALENAPGTAPSRPRSYPRRRAAIAAGAVLLAAAAGLIVWLTSRAPGTAVAREAEVIAVLPFRTSGPETGLMSEGMVDLLSRNLNEVGSIRTVDPRTVLSRWNRRGAARGDLATALEVGRAVGAGSVLTGSVIAAGQRVRLNAELRSLGGEELGQAQVEGPTDSVLALVDGLSLALLRSVWRSREPVPNLRVASLTTRSSDALRAYLEGEQYYRRTSWDSALVAYDRAVEADSTFALAHLRRAMTYGWTGGYGSAKSSAAAEAGLRFADRLPERDRTLLRAYHLFERGKPSTVDTLRRYVADHPEDVEAWYLLGEALFHSQGYTGADPDTIRAAFDSVLARDSTLMPAMLHPMELAMRARDSALFDDYGRRFVVPAGAAAVRMGQAIREMVWSREISDSAIRMVANGGPVGSVMLSLYRRPDVVPDFILRTSARVAAAVPAARRGFNLEMAAFAAAGLGQLEVASRLADSLARISPEDAMGVLGWPVLLGLAQPDFGGPRLAAWLRSPPPTAQTQYYLALNDLRQGHLAPARRRIDSTLAIRDTLAVPPHVRGRLVGARGWALLLAGDTAAALKDFRQAQEEAAQPREELESAPWQLQFALALAARPETRAEGIRRLRYQFDHPLLIPLTYLALGRAYQAGGDREEAEAAYAQFVRLWARADPSLQSYVREARAALGDLRD